MARPRSAARRGCPAPESDRRRRSSSGRRRPRPRPADARTAAPCRRGRRSRAAGRASSACPRGRGRWRARRGSGPRGRRAARGRARGAGACRASTGRPFAARPPRRDRRVPAACRRVASARPSSGRTRRAPRGRGGRRVAPTGRAGSRRPGQGWAGRGGGRRRIRAAPRSGSDRPTSIRIVVVLPAPLGPRNPVTVPGSQRNVTSETTVRPTSCFVSPSVWIMPADWWPAGLAATVRGLRSSSPAAVAGSDFGRGPRPWRSPSLGPRAMARQGTAHFTEGMSAWLRSALPGVVIDAPDEQRGRRDRVVDAAVYLGAFAISAATLAGTWEMHSPWLRVVDVVVGIATLVSLHWRRTHPAAVGIGVGAVSLVILTASGANLAATFNAAIRARGRDLAIIAGLLIAWAFASPLLYPSG